MDINNIMKMWKNIDKEIQCNLVMKKNISNSHDRLSKALRIHSFTTGVALFNISGNPITYVRIWKSGNNNIDENMCRIEFISKSKYKNDTFGTTPLSKYWFRLKNQRQEYYDRLSLFESNKRLSFTFVRDPFSRFKSGLREIIYRSGLASSLTIKSLKEFLNKFFCLNSDDMPQLAHIYPQSS
jgi:hypothetical protein